MADEESAGGAEAAPAAQAAPAATRVVHPPSVASEGTERLDASVSVVTTPLRLAIGVATVTLLAFVAWALFAKVTTSLTLSGTIIPPTGFISIVAPDDGYMPTINVKNGDQVATGQEVGTVQTTDRTLPLTAPIAGTVVEVLVGPDSPVQRGQVTVIMRPTDNSRAFIAFPDATNVEPLIPGQQAVLQVPSCPAITLPVSTVLGLPMTQDQVSREIGVSGLAAALMSGDIGFPVRISVPSDWCPDVDLGGFGSAVVTTGSTPAISLLIP